MAAKRNLSIVERCYPHTWVTVTVPSNGWVDSPTVEVEVCAKGCGARA